MGGRVLDGGPNGREPIGAFVTTTRLVSASFHVRSLGLPPQERTRYTVVLYVIVWYKCLSSYLGGLAENPMDMSNADSTAANPSHLLVYRLGCDLSKSVL